MAATCRCAAGTRTRSRNTNARSELDPLSLIANANLTRSLYWARRYDEAIAQARKTLEMDPQFGVALFWLEGALRHKGLFKEAVALRQAATTPEQAQRIVQMFETRGFPAVLRETWRDAQERAARSCRLPGVTRRLARKMKRWRCSRPALHAGAPPSSASRWSRTSTCCARNRDSRACSERSARRSCFSSSERICRRKSYTCGEQSP